jgi:hypothetical protein
MVATIQYGKSQSSVKNITIQHGGVADSWAGTLKSHGGRLAQRQ